MYEVTTLKYDEIKFLLIPEVADHFKTMGLGDINFDVLRKEVTEYLQEDRSTVLVLKKDGEIVGSLAASVALYLNGKLHAEQKFIFILKKHRGAYLQLTSSFEQWATSLGADVLSVSVLLRNEAQSQAKLLQKRGYKALDIYYIKTIGGKRHGR